MKLAGILEQTTQLLLCIDAPLVRSGFDPDNAFSVKVRFVHTRWNGQGNNHIAIFKKYILRLHHKRTANMLTGCIADQLIHIMHFSGRYARNGSIIPYANKNNATIGIGKSGHFRSQRIRIVDSGLELACAVLTRSDLLPERLKSECHASPLQQDFFTASCIHDNQNSRKTYCLPDKMSAAALLAATKVSGRNCAYFFLVKSTFLCVSISEIMSMLNLPLFARLTAK